MSTSTIYFYYVGFKEEQNAFVEDLHTYLTSRTPLIINDFQYLRLNLDIDIKVAISQSYVESFNYNYCTIVNDVSDKAYYYIRDVQQLSESVLKISLHQDVINTLGQANDSVYNPKNFNNRTFIKRQHKDRFYEEIPETYPFTVTRKFDRVQEEVNPQVWNKSNDEILYDTTLSGPLENNTWYLIYKAPDYDPENPVDKIYKLKEYVCADDEFKISILSPNKETKIDNEHYHDGVSDNSYTSTNNIGYITDSIWNNWIYSTAATYKGNITINNNNGSNLVISPGMSIQYGLLTPFSFPAYFECDWITIIGPTSTTINGQSAPAHTIWLRAHNTTNPSDIEYFPLSEKCRNLYDAVSPKPNIYVPGIQPSTKKYIRITDSNPLRAQLYPDYGATIFNVYYSTNVKTTKASIESSSHYEFTAADYQAEATIYSIDDVDTSDEKIVKIISSPYCPINIRYNSTDNKYFLDDASWAADNHLIKYNKTNYPALERTNLLNIDLEDEIEYTVNTQPTQDDLINSNSIDLESKLLTSQFKTHKISYDSFNKEIKLERYNSSYSENDTTQLSIDFKLSNGLSSNTIFKINTNSLGTYYPEEDYDDIMLVNRNSELPLMNSEYNNYVRNGYNYDVKTNNLQLQQAKTNAVINSVQTVANYGISSTFKPSASGVASAVIGAGSAIAKSAISINQMEESQAIAMSNKLGQLANSGVSVSGTSDLDILKYFNENKLHYIEYEPTEQFKSMTYDYLRRYGYLENTYGTPVVNTRIWYNYLQCTPAVINQDGIKKAKKNIYDEFINKYEDGVTIFHKRTKNYLPTYDFNQTHENWEVWWL